MRFWIVREFLRMFASEAKPTQNNTRDSLRTHLGVNLGTGQKTSESAGFPQHVWRDVQVVRRMGPKSVLWHTGGYPWRYRVGY